MKHSDFIIKEKFTCGDKTWLCTDIGTRVIVAIQFNSEDTSWNNGPPYAVLEHVFDEYDIEVCEPV
jgi:hypothetical protein